MTNEERQLIPIVAGNVRMHRERAGLSLSELAGRANIGKSTLSMLEAGKANPSIETLWAIASALGVPVGRLIEPQEPMVRVIREEDATRMAAEDARLVARLLLSESRRGPFEIYVMDIEPGPTHESRPHIQNSREYQYVISGSLRLGPSGSEVELRAGEMATFSGDQPHTYQALEPRTRVLQIMSYE